MQPVLIVESPIEGLLYINGRLAGEVNSRGRISLPVAPWGAVYVQHHPLVPGYLPIARRIALSAGRPVAEGNAGQRGIATVCWPNGAIDLEVVPDRMAGEPSRTHHAQVNDIQLRLVDGEPSRIEVYRAEAYNEQLLPSGAQPPELQVIDGFLYACGETDNGRYARIFAPDLSPALSIDAREIELSSDGAVRALIEQGDLVGHAKLMTWAQAGDQLQATSSETLWAEGKPRWPDTPQDTALAAAEAILLDLQEEAEAYFAPNALGDLYAAREAIRAAGGATKLRYPLIDGRQAVGLIQVEAPNCATILPLYYHALPMGGSQGTWRLDRFALRE